MSEFLDRRRFLVSAAAAGCALAGDRIAWAADGNMSADSTDVVKRAADFVLVSFPKPPQFDWGEGVLMTGMMRAYELTRDERYLDFVRDFGNHHHERGITQTLIKSSHRLAGYCGHWGPGFPMLMLYEETRDNRHWALAEEIIDFMQHKAERTADGGLTAWTGTHQLWVDTLDMCCPVYSHAARITNRPKLQEEAIRQLEIHEKHLRDPDAGLFHHMWDEKKGTCTDGFWGRGNGWVVMAYTEVLKNEKPDSPSYTRIAQPFKNLLAQLVPLQDPSTGLWHTILDKPDSYLEGSATSMYLYGMVECQNSKLVDVPYSDAMRRAWAGLAKVVEPNGRVGGVSGSTDPEGEAYYASRAKGTYTWGTGALLLAACAYAKSDMS